jgi:hypothetical protein
MARLKAVPAPTGGWNRRDSEDQMPETDAIVLDNWIPRAGRCELRRGYSEYVTGLGDNVYTLAQFDGTGTRKFIAAADGNLWDISTSTPSSLISSLTDDYWQTLNFDGKLGLVNGVDAPLSYDGSSVSSMTVSGSGLTVANLVNVSEFKSRTYFCEKNSLSFWYSAVNTLGGVLTKFPLGRVTSRGGYLMATGAWSRDSGSGPDDVFVAVTSNGEVIVYAGDDPGLAHAWSLIGKYHIAPPLGRRCLIRIGGELAIITTDGIVPMSAVINGLRGDSKATVSDKIRGQVIEDAQLYGSSQGWEGVFYPRSGLALFNVPVSPDVTYTQYVLNTSDNPGAWCRFTGWNSRCFGTYNDRLYFGGDGAVYLADEGRNDNGASISADAKTAFNYLSDRARIKLFSGMRPVMSADGDITVSTASAVDFGNYSAITSVTIQLPSGAAWDEAEWDEEEWISQPNRINYWAPCNNIGYNVSGRIKVDVSGQEVRWFSINYLFNPGGLI